MLNSINTWITSISLSNPIERRQARVFQYFLIGWLAITFIAVLLLNVAGAPPAEASPLLQLSIRIIGLASILLWLSPAVALVVLRRGYFRHSVAVAAFGLLLSQAVALILLGVTGSVLLVFMIPIVFAGLLAGRWLLLTVSGLSLLLVLITAILQNLSPPLAGFMTSELSRASSAAGGPVTVGESPGILLGFFFVVIVLLTLLLDRFGRTLRDALFTSLARESELRDIRALLEASVAERTAALQQALDDVQARVEEQARLLGQIDQQRATITGLSVPVIPVSAHTLVMPLIGELDDGRLRMVQQQSLQVLERSSARTLLLDITGVPIVDSYVAQGLLATARSARLLGAEVAIVGIRPEVAQTMVGIGVDLSGVRTFSDLQSALTSA